MILRLAEAALASGEETTGEESESGRGAILASVVEATILAVGDIREGVMYYNNH